MLLKRILLGGFPSGQMELSIAESVDFMVDRVRHSIYFLLLKIKIDLFSARIDESGATGCTDDVELLEVILRY